MEEHLSTQQLIQKTLTRHVTKLARIFGTVAARKRRALRQFTDIQTLEVRRLLSATTTATTTTPTPRLNTAEKIVLHQAIHQQVDGGVADIIFVGDSITQRWAQEGSAAFEQYFGAYDTINMGIGGDATQSTLWRLQDYNLANISPEVTVLNIGTNNICWPSQGTCTGNDTPQDTAAGVEANVNYLRQALPNTQILVLGLLPRDQFSDGPHRQPIVETNQLLNTLDDGKFVHYLDIGDLFLESNGEISTDTMFDYLHPTESGFGTFAAAITPVIEGLLDGYQPPVVFEGTAGNDSFHFIADNETYRVSFNGAIHTFTAPVNIQFNANGGSDVIRVEGNAGNDVVTLGVNSLQLAGDGYMVTANEVEFKTVLAGGGHNSANLFDSDGNDRLITKPSLAYITGPGLYSAVIGFEQVTAFASEGYDLADHYDSSGDDILTNTSNDVSMTNSAGDFNNSARNFDYVRSTATAGGYDQAQFYDSAADDYFIARPHDAYMRDVDHTYFNHAKGFEVKRAFATAGGNDEAQFYDSVNDDYFIAKPDFSYMRNKTGSAFYSYASGFARSLAYSMNGGNDEAQFYDSSASDRLQAKQTYAYIYGATYLNYGRGFSVVVAVANGGGHDRLDQQSGLTYAFYRYNGWEEIHSI
jgi:lysophospholipase L1-like esterase